MARTLNHQAVYKARRYKAGICAECPKSIEGSVYKRLCDDCGDAKRMKMRKKQGSKPWKPGSAGRKPNWVKWKEQQQGYGISHIPGVTDVGNNGGNDVES